MRKTYTPVDRTPTCMSSEIEFNPDLRITESRTVDDSGKVSIGKKHAGKPVKLIIVDFEREETDETSNVINSETVVQNNGTVYIGRPYAGRTTSEIRILFKD